MTQSKRSLVLASAAAAAMVAQLVAFWRYLDRLPGDWIGLTLYVVTIALFASAATLFFVKWRTAVGPEPRPALREVRGGREGR